MKALKNIIIIFILIVLVSTVFFIYTEKDRRDGGLSDREVNGDILSNKDNNPIKDSQLDRTPNVENENQKTDTNQKIISFNITNKNYIDNSDGTITDPETGLMWTKDFYGKSIYSEAGDYLGEYYGYDDWRIPNIKELYSLMDFSGVDPDAKSQTSNNLKPFIDTDYFDFSYGDVSNGDRIIDSQWITTNIYTSKVMRNEQCFFGVNFADGRIKCYPVENKMNNGYFLRLVRGNEYGENSFIDNGDGTIFDETTGLTWQKSDSGKGLDWYEAIKYCNNLEISNKKEWRLPNIKELQYIVDYSKSPDSTNSAAIDSIFKISSIKNESGEVDYPFFWSDTTHLNHNGNDFAAYVSFGRAMGKMMGSWVDVHGAGAQRSDPKVGDPDDYPDGFGPQGDARRIYNYVRCVND